uniref:Putative structural protein n=1 Tax=viral metagenome TaxID=1070528 RepID=A0A6M3J892_9ZZZZ
MATVISRTWYNSLTDDDGTLTTGTPIDKADFGAILDAIDALIAGNIAFGGTLTTVGSVGIGMTGPGTPLHILQSSAAINNLLTLENAWSSSSANEGTGIYFKGYYKQALITAYENPSSQTGGNLQLQTYSDDSTLNTGIVLTRLGNVGIGTTAPLAKLAVNGGLHVGGDSDPGDNNALIDGTLSVVGGGTAYSNVVAETSRALIGQDSTHNVQLNWIYDATPANAYARLNTYANANALYLDASAVLINTGSATPTTVGGTLGVTGLTTLAPAAGANQALYINQTGGGSGAALYYNKLYLTGDNYAGGDVKVEQLMLEHHYGGAAMTGGRNTFEVFSFFDGVSNASNPDRNYAAAAFSVYANDDDGGSGGSEQGAFFALTGNAIANNGATNLHDLTWAELNVKAATGSSMKHKSCIRVSAYGLDAVQGSTSDAAIELTRQSGGTLSTTVGWNHGVLFSNTSGDYPMATDGTLFGVSGAATVANGVDLLGWTISGFAWRSTSGTISFQAANQVLELGSTTVNQPALDFHSSANAIDYDSRIVASGGAATAGFGDLSVYGVNLTVADVAFGAGAIVGPRIGVGRNSSGNGAAGTVSFTDKAGNVFYLWVDATGDLRIHSAAPTEDGTTVSDTAGTVVGAQS